jgi:hypothetical protein
VTSEVSIKGSEVTHLWSMPPAQDTDDKAILPRWYKSPMSETSRAVLTLWSGDDRGVVGVLIGVAQTASADRGLVCTICAPWERGDFSSVEWADPEIEYGS